MTESTPLKSRNSYIRLIAGIVIIGSLIIASRFFRFPDCAEIQQQVAQAGNFAPIIYFIIYVIATITFIPGTIITLVAGLAFGSIWGTIIVSLASTTGASLAFFISRYLLRDTLEKRLSSSDWFGKLKNSLTANGLNFVLFVRLVPLFPFNGLNYACGLLPLKFRDYLLGSIVGMLPGTFAYVYLGETGCKLIDPVIQGKFSFANMPEDVRTSLLISIALLAFLSILPILIKKFRA